ncbi:MAG: DNA polymerase IV [Thaumarchaeota archaeon]|nr:MAG: DNA polymerase IV [Nitrososphaerota archaeon]
MSDPSLLEETPGDRFILHVDMDSFYASAEIRRNPAFAAKPVIVGADPREGKGRGVVVACNYVSRGYGVRSGMPISRAWALCPGAVYVRPDFDYYVSLSTKVMEVVRRFADKFEQVSIDEAFLDVSDRVKTPAAALSLVERLRRELIEKTGLTCSVGIAENKSAAKIATDINKPDRVTLIPRGRAKEFLAPLPIGRITGVGRKTELLLQGLGITTIGDLQKADENQLGRRLGRMARWLVQVANGVERAEIREQPSRSLSTERTLEEDTTDWDVIEQMVGAMAEELASRAVDARLSFKSVGIKIRFEGFETHTRETRLVASTQDRGVIRREALLLLSRFRSGKKKVRLVGVRISGLRMMSARQASIESWLGIKEESG